MVGNSMVHDSDWDQYETSKLKGTLVLVDLEKVVIIFGFKDL
jgi:hypothetical protein